MYLRNIFKDNEFNESATVKNFLVVRQDGVNAGHPSNCVQQIRQRGFSKAVGVLYIPRWGSCSPSGTIILNLQLVKTPTRCIDYVIIHELCHLKEHNHSRAFYCLMCRAMPHWERLKAELDGLSELYLNN